MATNYKRGYAFERRVRIYFEENGFYVVRSAGSHGVADLVAFQRHSNRPPILIQCKRHGAISNAEKAKLFNTAKEIYAWPMLAYMNQHRTLIFELLDTEHDGHEVRFG